MEQTLLRQTANVRQVLKKNHASSGSQGRTWNLYTNTCTDLGFGWYSSVGQSCQIYFYIHVAKKAYLFGFLKVHILSNIWRYDWIWVPINTFWSVLSVPEKLSLNQTTFCLAQVQSYSIQTLPLRFWNSKTVFGWCKLLLKSN